MSVAPKATAKADSGVSHAAILRELKAMRREVGSVKTDVGKLRDAVGEEKVGDDGKATGSGLTGRVISIERRDAAEDLKWAGWRGTLRGVLWAVGIILPISWAVIWYLGEDGLNRTFKANASVSSAPAVRP